MRYIQSFSTSSDVQTALDNTSLGKPYVAYIESDGDIDWNTKEKTDYSKMYLTFNIISGGTINWKAYNTSYITTISYSKDSGATWTDITATTAGTSFNVSAGDNVMIKGDNDTWGTFWNYNTFSGSTAVFEVEGNIMSLIYGDDFATATTLTAFAFYGLFQYCTGLTSAEKLVLPATTSDNCYSYMFQGCTSLTTAPELPATTLAYMCYSSMFEGCTSLNYIKCLATDISATYCTGYWVNGVASTGTFVKNPNMSNWTSGLNGIPTNWTVQDA